ncbi:MAG: hypothetical protein MR239_06020 [Clostridiales bacterium]|nr:hypothetical protein [Clostridiales bacterium]
MKTTAKSFLFCCVTLCMTIAMLTVGCTNGKQYFEKGTEVGFQNRYGEYTIVCEFDENSLGEEYAKKYRNFCKEEGIAAKEELRDATVYRMLRMIIGGQASSYTLKSVAEVPSSTQVVYFNGRKRLGKGEILVHKWTYYTFLANTFGFYIDDDLAKKILDSDDVLPKHIALLECSVVVADLGISVDYYGYSSVLDEKIGKKEMPIMLYETEKRNSADITYKEYVVAGYYIDKADYDYLDTTYDREQFSTVLELRGGGIGETETEIAIRKKLSEIRNAFYVR